MQWRFLTDDDLPGARNMARDVAILEAVSEGSSPATVRLYGWDPPCLTLGRHQGLDAADLAFCAGNGVDVVRRPTGGRALLHHLELTYAVIAPLGVSPLPRNLQDAYRRVCAGLVRACHELDVEAELTGGEVNLRLPSPTSTAPCFEAPAGGEVVVRGRKLIGSAMRAHAGCTLQHGAILLDWDARLQAGALGLQDDAALRPHITTLADELGREVPRGEVAAALRSGLAADLGIDLLDSALSEPERRREEELVGEYQIQTAGDPAP